MKYQMIYKLNSKTHYSFINSSSWKNAKEVFEKLIVGELVEIREIIQEDKTIKKDDKNYIHSCTVKISSLDKNKFNSIKIPKLIKSLDEKTLTNLTKQYIKLDSVTPYFIRLSKIFKD